MLTGNGANLSQGQRQLLAIARAAVADPPVMILDEATSSIDTRTEAIVQRGMDALMTGRTTFVIAHRLSTVQNADAIMVLDHGRIIERGTHEDLIKLEGHLLSALYRRAGAGLTRFAALGEVQRKPSDRKGARPRCFPGKPGGGAAPLFVLPGGRCREAAWPAPVSSGGCRNNPI